MTRILSILCFLAGFLIAGCQPSTPSEEQVKADLIGQTMGDPFSFSWKFESLAEFEQLEITDRRQQGNLLEYDVHMRLRDTNMDRFYTANTVIAYRRTNNRWDLVSVSRGSLQQVPRPAGVPLNQ